MLLYVRIYYMYRFVAMGCCCFNNSGQFSAISSARFGTRTRVEAKPAMQGNMFSAIPARVGRLQAADAQASSSLAPCPNCGPEPGVPCSHFGLVAPPTRPPARRPSLRASVCSQDGFSRIHESSDSPSVLCYTKAAVLVLLRRPHTTTRAVPCRHSEIGTGTSEPGGRAKLSSSCVVGV